MTSEPDHVERMRLEDVIALCRKRMERAEAKLRAAVTEDDEATAALIMAQGDLARWDVEHPDPQGSLFPEGNTNV
ncbi:hypothetical protein [Sphingobium sp. B2]|uniref:hypothetical protein n=1 Tax=Sphingobium sp. B2 TaxID=2583228 RepID=UPI0011A96C40|nr:hypothetical protein [Sphingobium sp. B2]